LRLAWGKDPTDIGLGLYNPSTGEIHVSSYDASGQMGHDGLQQMLGIPDAARPNWRGFLLTSGGQAVNTSSFNNPDGGLQMRQDFFAEVLDALRRAGLI
jgi:hypothetical protein